MIRSQGSSLKDYIKHEVERLLIQRGELYSSAIMPEVMRIMEGGKDNTYVYAFRHHEKIRGCTSCPMSRLQDKGNNVAIICDATKRRTYTDHNISAIYRHDSCPLKEL